MLISHSDIRIKFTEFSIEQEELMRRGGDYRRVFEYFDENGDGKISASELRRCVGLIGRELSPKEAESAIDATDSDGDGLLSLDEFVGLMEGESEGEEEKIRILREAFEIYDEDGCGFISPKSLKRMLKRLGQTKSKDECTLMIRHFDLDGDGLLSFDEFKIMMQ